MVVVGVVVAVGVFVVDVEIGYEFKGKKSETVATQAVEATPTSESTPATEPAAQPQPTP